MATYKKYRYPLSKEYSDERDDMWINEPIDHKSTGQSQSFLPVLCFLLVQINQWLCLPHVVPQVKPGLYEDLPVVTHLKESFSQAVFQQSG